MSVNTVSVVWNRSGYWGTTVPIENNETVIRNKSESTDVGNKCIFGLTELLGSRSVPIERSMETTLESYLWLVEQSLGQSGKPTERRVLIFRMENLGRNVLELWRTPNPKIKNETLESQTQETEHRIVAVGNQGLQWAEHPGETKARTVLENKLKPYRRKTEKEAGICGRDWRGRTRWRFVSKARASDRDGPGGGLDVGRDGVRGVFVHRRRI